MADRKRFILPPSGDLVLPAAAADALFAQRDADAAYLYMYILKMEGFFSEKDALRTLGFDPKRMVAALSCLARLGLVNGEAQDASPTAAKAAPDSSQEDEIRENREYTAEEAIDQLEQGGEFACLVRDTERRLSMSRRFSVEELKRFMGLYHDSALPPEVLFLLVTYCVEDFKSRFGEGRRPTVRQIEQEGWRWAAKGLDTSEAATDYIRYRRERQSALGRTAAVMGISGRRLSPSEEKYIASWLDLGFKEEALALAYDKTVIKTGKLSWKYMDTIVKSWREKNLFTPQEIEAGDRPAPRGHGPAAGGVGAPQDASYKDESLEWVKNYRKGRQSGK